MAGNLSLHLRNGSKNNPSTTQQTTTQHNNMTTSPYIESLRLMPPIVKIEKRHFPLRWVLFIDHTWAGTFPTKKLATKEAKIRGAA
jgi:hypothetical protein